MNDTAAATWRPDRLLRALLIWTAFTTVFFWLPTVRGLFDGPSYQWGLFGFAGRGTSGDYWFPVVSAGIAIFTLMLGWRGARPPFHLLLAAWHLFLASAVTYYSATNPSAVRFQGDTLGVDVSLAAVGPLLFGTWACLALYWAVRDLRTPAPARAPFQASWNTRRIGVLVAMFPIQLLLLRFAGFPAADPIGVVLTILQWMLVGPALRAYAIRRDDTR